jgi:predicted phosphoadenosine phosphosulfate sulfurtransferase
MPAAGSRQSQSLFLPQRQLDTDVWTLALERAAATLDAFDHVAVMFSGGKDSTATLNVTLEAARADPRRGRHLPLRVIFCDEEAIPLETEQYVRRTFARPDIAGEWYCLPVKHRNACSRTSPHWWPWAPEAEPLWCRPLPPEAITSLPGFPLHPAAARLTNPQLNALFFPPHLGNCAILMGIRAQESMNRMRAVTRQPVDNYLTRGSHDGTARSNIWRSYPVYDWTVEDVWTAPDRFGWDHNEAYDLMEMAGIPHRAQRCSPAFAEEPLQRFHTYAQCFPDVWEKMTARVPGVGAAYRYALTELYAYSGKPAKPAGMSWPEFLRHYAQRHDQAVTASIASRLGQELRRHYKLTTHPVSETAPHPMTGLSWEFMLTIAMRGDLKRRRAAGMHARNDELSRPEAAGWRRYAAELEQIIAEGRFGELGYPGPQPDPAALIPEYARQ